MSRYRTHLFLCTNERPAGHTRGSCAARGAEGLLEIVKEEAKKAGVPVPFRANRSGCLDACEFGPVLAVYPEGVFYTVRTREEIARVMVEHLVGGKIVRELAISDPPRSF
ncbi:MAG: (2Fe-2S) ferredoxin domain-containing protein [Leptospirillia bacterium]